MQVTLARSFSFDASHCLPAAPEGHKCRRPHGHGYTVVVEVAGEVDPATGWLIDFAELAAACDPVRAQLDHRHLNDVPGLENPTAEHIARWVWDRLRPSLAILDAVTVQESPTSRCTYRGR